jgi:ammonia channel protein AmtB
VIGFTLTYGPDQGGVIGNFDHAFLINVAYDTCSPNAPTIPAAIFAMFQMMFAVRTSPLHSDLCVCHFLTWTDALILVFHMFCSCVYVC